MVYIRGVLNDSTSRDKLILNDKKFHTVLALDSPIEFSPKLFGMTPQVACTACWNGFWCDFRISMDSFVVENLYVNSKDDYYPEINGVNPTLEPCDDSKLLKYMGHHFYKCINYSVPYTGKLLAVGGFLVKYMVYMGPQRLRAYSEVSEWTFEDGKVIACKDLNAVIQSFRDELEETAGEERANPFLKYRDKRVSIVIRLSEGMVDKLLVNRLVGKMDNIGLLNDTLEIALKGYYRKGIKKVALSYSPDELQDAIVYLPDDVELIRNNPTCNAPIKMGSRCQFRVSNCDSFLVVTDPLTQKFYTELLKDKTPFLVLNFANSVSPGGGVRRGAKAQEEDLCRKSTLLTSLESERAKPYYLYHRANDPYLASDAMILSPYVEIVRDENNELLDEPIKVAVLTCAAPNLMRGNQGLTVEQLEELLYQRIQGIVAMAASLNYNKLVLGAWGCGAFRNDAKLVADLFLKAFKAFKCGYRKADTLFDQVTFAVLDRSSVPYNYNCFNKAFADYYAEDDKAADEAVLERIRKKEQAYLDKIQGSLVGGAIGDAFGYPVEFLSLDAIKQKYGPSGITKYELDKQTGTAVISDDTQMTLFTATGLLVGDTRLSMRGIAGEPSSYVFLSYLNWMETQGVTIADSFRVSWLMDVKELYVRRAPGNTCLSALEGRTHKSEYATTKKPINNSKGCGGVMRVAPVGLFYNLQNIERVNEIAADIAAITHSHPLGYIPAAMLAHIVNRLIYGNCQRGNSLLHIIEESVETAHAHYGDISDMAYMASLIKRAIEFSGNNNTDAENIKALGEGWVAEEALAIAIYCALKYQNDFSKAMIASVNHDGDSDSTGAITGNILGALIGYVAIPDCWKKDLEIRDVILEVATDLCQGCQMSEYGTYNDPKWVSKYMQMKAY